MNETDLRNALKAVLKRQRPGDVRPLSTFIDVYSFNEPYDARVTHECQELLVIAAANYGPHYVELSYRIEALEAKVRFCSKWEGTMALNNELPADSSVNWRVIQLVASEVNVAEDCKCLWTGAERSIQWTAITLTRHET